MPFWCFFYVNINIDISIVVTYILHTMIEPTVQSILLIGYAAYAPMRSCIYYPILSAKRLIASWCAALRFWAVTPRHARTGTISVYGIIPVSIGYALSALTCRFNNGLPNKRPEFCAAIIFMLSLPYLKNCGFCGISIHG